MESTVTQPVEIVLRKTNVIIYLDTVPVSVIEDFRSQSAIQVCKRAL